MAQASRLLAGHYHLVATNVPYLVRNKQGEALRDFLASEYPNSIPDLATAFLERCRQFCERRGVYATVTPQNWLFLTSYRNLRVKLLQEQMWHHVAKLGSGATAKESWEVLRTLSIICNDEPPDSNLLTGIEAGFPTEEEKATWLMKGDLVCFNQEKQRMNPDSRIAFKAMDQFTLLSEYAYSHHGLTTGDLPRLFRFFWEFSTPSSDWIIFQSTVTETCYYGGLEGLLYWCNGLGPISELPGGRQDGLQAWHKTGVLVSQMRQLPVTIYIPSVRSYLLQVIRNIEEPPSKSEFFDVQKLLQSSLVTRNERTAGI